jgi:hypothetical protein
LVEAVSGLLRVAVRPECFEEFIAVTAVPVKCKVGDEFQRGGADATSLLTGSTDREGAKDVHPNDLAAMSFAAF